MGPEVAVPARTTFARSVALIASDHLDAITSSCFVQRVDTTRKSNGLHVPSGCASTESFEPASEIDGWENNGVPGTSQSAHVHSCALPEIVGHASCLPVGVATLSG